MPNAEQLKEKFRQAVRDAREARNRVQALLTQFKEAEEKAAVEEGKFASIAASIAELDRGFAQEKLATDEEVADYGELRLSMLAKRDKQLTMMRNAQQVREQLRMETLRADKAFARREQETRNLESLLENRLGKVEGGAYYIA